MKLISLPLIAVAALTAQWCFAAPGADSEPFTTHYQVFTSATAMFDLQSKRTLAQITDGPANTIGIIEGDAIAVSGPMSAQVVHGQVKTVLRSGSDVRVKSGTAQIALIDGGVIKICGPAHLSILKTAGALTVALESGTIHAHIAHDMLLTVYTAQIKAEPIAIGDAPLDMLVGFDNPGTMCIRSTRGAIRIEVADTGSGLSAEECARLFTPYYTTKHQGTGLGLAIVQSVVSDHQGSISVSSEEGRGTTFRIELPQRQANQPAAPREDAGASKIPPPRFAAASD